MAHVGAGPLRYHTLPSRVESLPHSLETVQGFVKSTVASRK